MNTEQIEVPRSAPVLRENEKGQFLTFILASQEYGVDILRVQEIKGWDKTTPMPNSPDYMRGVINLRGTIVPIIDLRRRFLLESIDYSKTTVVIVLKVMDDSGERTMGFVVDAVSDVYDVGPDQLKPAPGCGPGAASEVVKGLATVDGKMIILLDIDRLVNGGAEQQTAVVQ